MMAVYTKLTTKCPCGHEISTFVKKPTALQHSVAKVMCAHCQSRFLVSCAVQKGSVPRQYKPAFDVLHLSKRAASIIREKKKSELGAS